MVCPPLYEVYHFFSCVTCTATFNRRKQYVKHIISRCTKTSNFANFKARASIIDKITFANNEKTQMRSIASFRLCSLSRNRAIDIRKLGREIDLVERRESLESWLKTTLECTVLCFVGLEIGALRKYWTNLQGNSQLFCLTRVLQKLTRVYI